MPKRVRSDKSVEKIISKKQRQDEMEAINPFPEETMTSEHLEESGDEEVNLFAESPQPERESEIITADVHQPDEEQQIAQNEENFDFLGVKPKKDKETKESLHEQLVLRWSSYIENGIEKEQKEAIIGKYPLFENCPLLKAPALGPELTSCLNQKTLRQDKFMAQLQKEAGHALSAIGFQINKLLVNNTEENKEITTVLADVAQLICNVQHALSTHRKYNILPFLNYSCRKLVENSITDELLLGKNFIQDMKANETARKTGLDLKSITPFNKPSTSKPYSKFTGNNIQPQINYNYSNTRKNLNFKRQPSNTKKKMSNHQTSQQRYKNDYRHKTTQYQKNRN